MLDIEEMVSKRTRKSQSAPVEKDHVRNIKRLMDCRIGDIAGKYSISYDAEMITLRNNGFIVIARKKVGSRFAINDMHHKFKGGYDAGMAILQENANQLVKVLGYDRCLCMDDHVLIFEKGVDTPKRVEYRAFFS